VHTKDLNTAIKMADGLKAGTVWVNSYNTLHWSLPFGGFKVCHNTYSLDIYCTNIRIGKRNWPARLLSCSFLHWSFANISYRELGKYALENYTQVKTVSINMQGALFG